MLWLKTLAKAHKVCSVDLNQKALEPLSEAGIKTLCTDVSNKDNLQKIIKEYDIVVGAVPGFMGYKMMKHVIEAGKNM